VQKITKINISEMWGIFGTNRKLYARVHKECNVKVTRKAINVTLQQYDKTKLKG